MRFVCDAMLGKLAKYMRMLGLDTEYINNINLINKYKDELDAPFLLTKRSFLKIPYDKHITIKSEHVEQQLTEIRALIKPFTREKMLMGRCICCNKVLIDANKTDIEQFVPEYVLHHYDRFKKCPFCKKIYWQGTHARHMTEWIQKFMAEE